ncbi:restriction endonuclease subunit S [Weissella cibaria]
MSNKVPQIRFNGYSDAWVQRKLGELGRTFTGLSGKTKEDFGHGDARFVTYMNVFSNPISSLTETDAVEIDDKQHQVQKGDVFFTTSSETPEEVGMSSVWVFDLPNVYLNSFSFGYRPTTQFDLNYLAFMLRSPQARKSIMLLAQGISRYNISKTKMMDIKVPVPSIEEQEVVGRFFSNIDNLIAANQRKLDFLKEQKKGYLQKMFPKNGAKVPELRFAGFADDWEERKLGELSNIVGGGTPSTSNPEYWDGDIDWYAPAEIGEQSYVSKSKKTITELGLKKSSARILPVGTVLFTSRAGIGNTAILAKEATTNQGFQSIVPDQNKLDSYFIFSRTNELKRYGEVTGAGSTFVEVSGKQMSKMSIMVPELSEQQKIGSFFKQLDDTIALHQRKLDLLKEQKKGFLQKMFV